MPAGRRRGPVSSGLRVRSEFRSSQTLIACSTWHRRWTFPNSNAAALYYHSLSGKPCSAQVSISTTTSTSRSVLEEKKKQETQVKSPVSMDTIIQLSAVERGRALSVTTHEGTSHWTDQSPALTRGNVILFNVPAEFRGTWIFFHACRSTAKIYSSQMNGPGGRCSKILDGTVKVPPSNTKERKR